MADLFDGYPLGEQWDEMFGGPAQPRAAYLGLYGSLQPMAADELAARADLLSQTYRDAGVTFAHAGEEQPFPLDIVPRVIGPEEWAVIERGVGQRVLALEAFLADVYGAGEVFDDGVVPRSVVTTSAHFHRQAHGLVPPNGVRVHVAGIDLVRDEAGDFRVLEDNLRSPSGVSYVITNRSAMSQVLPELFADHRIQPVDDYPTRLLAALKASAPSNVADPTVVVLTPGVYNSATSSTRCSPARWGSSWSRAATSCAPATRSACGRRTASAASTSSTGGSTTSSSTPCTSGRTR